MIFYCDNCGSPIIYDSFDTTIQHWHCPQCGNKDTNKTYACSSFIPNINPNEATFISEIPNILTDKIKINEPIQNADPIEYYRTNAIGFDPNKDNIKRGLL